MVLGCPDGRRKKRSGARRVFAVFEDGLPACKRLRAAAGKTGREAKKTFQRRRIFALSAGQAAGLGAPCKKLPEERHKHMARASGLLDFRGLRGAAPGLKGFASCAKAVRAPGKNSQFAGRSKFRDVCRQSGEVSQTPSEAVCRPANAPIPPKFQTFCGAGRRFRNASQKAASEAA